MLHLYLFSTAIFMLTELANCMPPPLLWPCSTRLSTSYPFSVRPSFILYTGKLWNSSFVCFSTCLWLELFQKRSVKTPLMLNWTSIPCFYFRTALSTGVGDKRDYFERFTFEGIPQHYRVQQGHRAHSTDLRLSQSHEHMSSLSISQDDTYYD